MSDDTEIKTSAAASISKSGLWTNNVALVQLLGLCPLLAVTGTVINGLGLGIATLITLVLSNSVVSLIRPWLKSEIRIPIFVLIIASIVTTIELVMNAWFHELYLILGIFIPLIVTNCSIIARAEAFASKNNLLDSALDGFMMGLGFALVLVVLGGLRELIGFGTLFANAQLMFGSFGASTLRRRSAATTASSRSVHSSSPDEPSPRWYTTMYDMSCSKTRCLVQASLRFVDRKL